MVPTRPHAGQKRITTQIASQRMTDYDGPVTLTYTFTASNMEEALLTANRIVVSEAKHARKMRRLREGGIHEAHEKQMRQMYKSRDGSEENLNRRRQERVVSTRASRERVSKKQRSTGAVVVEGADAKHDLTVGPADSAAKGAHWWYFANCCLVLAFCFWYLKKRVTSNALVVRPTSQEMTLYQPSACYDAFVFMVSLCALFLWKKMCTKCK